MNRLITEDEEPMPSSPPVRRRQLGMELARLRKAADMDQAAAADWLGLQESAISKMENGKQKATVAHVKLLCQLYGVDSPLADMLEKLARESAQRGWWAQYGKTVPSWFADYVGMETAAAEVWTYEQELIPGLGQTSEYFAAMTRANEPRTTDAKIASMVSVREQRQARLYADDEPLHLRAVVNEGALCRAVGGPEVMQGQLDRLISLAALPHVTIQVLPFSAGAHPAMLGAFTALRFPEEPMNTIYIELDKAALYLERPSEIESYSTTFEQLAGLALNQPDSVAFLQKKKESW